MNAHERLTLRCTGLRFAPPVSFFVRRNWVIFCTEHLRGLDTTMENQKIDLTTGKDLELLLDSIWKLHNRILDYDVHYSNVRVSLITVLITIAGVSGYELITNNFPALAIIPGLFLVCLVFLSNWLLNAMLTCKKQAEKLEELATRIMLTKTATSDDFDLLKFTQKFLTEIKLWNPKSCGFWKVDLDEIGNILFLIIAISYLFIFIFVWLAR